jgi:hypothetical protein
MRRRASANPLPPPPIAARPHARPTRTSGTTVGSVTTETADMSRLTASRRRGRPEDQSAARHSHIVESRPFRPMIRLRYDIPTITELPARHSAVARDPFIDDLANAAPPQAELRSQILACGRPASRAGEAVTGSPNDVRTTQQQLRDHG